MIYYAAFEWSTAVPLGISTSLANTRTLFLTEKSTQESNIGSTQESCVFIDRRRVRACQSYRENKEIGKENEKQKRRML